ncbi:MAG: SAP domain-containing protein, partial [Candidatus Heimdallarchaeaceae archaeon]
MSQIDIDKMKLKELKAECKKRGLPVSGNKSVLIARLKAGKSAIKRKASRKPRKRKSAKRKASRKRKSAKKAAKKSRKRKSAKRKASKKVAKRKPSTKKSRTQDWAAMTKAEISKELKS